MTLIKSRNYSLRISVMDATPHDLAKAIIHYANFVSPLPRNSDLGIFVVRYPLPLILYKILGPSSPEGKGLPQES